MAINLNKNRESLLAAWKDVLNDKTPTDWALFGYEGLTNDLKVVATGSGGVEELVEDLNSGKIMYAFLRVMDPKTSLPKNVLINWQGEGAPNVRKGTCANHVREVNSFFKGAHVTVNARTEEEVDPEIIIDKVAKSTGSAYSFKERAEYENDSGPVGTSYKRVIPKQEINALERDKFWEREEQEERQRQEEERRRRDEEKRLLEEERKKRECEEAAKREAIAKERNNSINHLRKAENSERELYAGEEQKSRRDIVEDIEMEERERRDRAEILRRQRSQEAQQLISTRTIDARAVFEQNTSAMQYNSRKGSLEPNRKMEKGRETSVVTAAFKVSLPTWSQAPPEPQIRTQAAEPVSDTADNCEEEEQEWEDKVKTNKKSEEFRGAKQKEMAGVEAVQSDIQNGDYGLTARALYDYQAADDTEITFDPGDIITHIDQIDEGWWQGVGPNGVFGLFPANYVEIIN